MEQSTWEANSHSASQEIPVLYGTWRFKHVHEPTTGPIISQGLF